VHQLGCAWSSRLLNNSSSSNIDSNNISNNSNINNKINNHLTTLHLFRCYSDLVCLSSGTNYTLYRQWHYYNNNSRSNNDNDNNNDPRQWHYYTLTNEGIEYLREVLHLPTAYPTKKLANILCKSNNQTNTPP
jgi:hypothetical protein